ncbi:MAG: ImuA family protein [Candidatus Puniceispirillaceae bacterium]
MTHAGDHVMPSHSGPAMVSIYQQYQSDDHREHLRPQARHRQFHQLRRDVAALDGQLTAARLPLGVDSLDSALAGGLALGRVHMLCGRPGHDGALTGFAVALLRRILARVDAAAPIVWCPAASSGGSGMLHAAGLAALGLDPGRLLIVDSPSPGARLAALEDILHTEGLAAVIVEYDGVSQSSDYWMRLARRAQLAAEASGVTGLLLGWPVAATGFDTLWRIAPAAPASMVDSGQASAARPWHPCWQVDLMHARGGRAHSLYLSWDAHANRLSELPPETSNTDSPASGHQEVLPLAGLPPRTVRPSRPRRFLTTAVAG